MVTGNANHRRICDRWVGQQGLLQIHGIDVETTRDDHVLAAVQNINEPVLIDPAHVATAIEHLAFGAGPQHLGCLLRPIHVAAHHGNGAPDNLTNLPLWQFMALVVNDPYLAPSVGSPTDSHLSG